MAAIEAIRLHKRGRSQITNRKDCTRKTDVL
jgi:hypothetical protein